MSEGRSLTEQPITDQLQDWYREYIGQPDQQRDIYLGFGLFFGGVALGLIGLVVFLVEGALSTGGPIYPLREVAFSIAALGLPALLLGIVVLLPGDDRVRTVAIVGSAITVVAVLFFVSVYPYNWDVGRQADFSTEGIALYAVGLVTVLGAAASALVGYHVERAAPAPTPDDTDDEDDEPSVTDAEVERDIEEAMQSTDISWGGVRKTETRSIQIEMDDDLDTSGFDDAAATTVRSEASVDDQVSSLQGLRGGNDRTDRSTQNVDDQTAALKQLRAEKMASEEGEMSSAAAAGDGDSAGGLLARIKRLFS
jgi:hypothetical protein